MEAHTQEHRKSSKSSIQFDTDSIVCLQILYCGCTVCMHVQHIEPVTVM